MKKILFILLILSVLIISCVERNGTSKTTIPSDRFKNIKDSISKKINNGDIPGEHLLRCPQTTLLNLKYKNGKLIGTAAALASNSSRMHYALSYYLKLEKEQSK